MLSLKQDAVIAYKQAVSLNPLVLDALVALAGLGVGKEEIWEGVITKEGAPFSATPAAAAPAGGGGGRRPGSSSGSSANARRRNNSSSSSSRSSSSQEDNHHHHQNEQEDLQSLRASSLLWLELFLSAHLAMQSQKYTDAASAFNDLETQFFPSSTHCLLQKARVQIEMDLLVDAHKTFGRVIGEGGREGGLLEHMDYYAVLLRQKGAGGALAGLAHRLMALDMTRPEAWIAASLHSDMRGEKEGSLNLIDRAIQVSLSLLLLFLRFPPLFPPPFLF